MKGGKKKKERRNCCLKLTSDEVVMGRLSEAIQQKIDGASVEGCGVRCTAGEGAAWKKPNEVMREILLLQLVAFNC